MRQPWFSRPARLAAVALTCAVAALIRVPVSSQDRPLPDKAAFLDETRKRLSSDDRRQGRYSYREHQLREDYDGDGRIEKRVTHEFEVYPSVDGSPAFRRLIAVNGVPEPAVRLAEADRKHREKLQEWARDRRSETPADRARREAKAKRDEAHEARIIDDIVRVYDIHLVSREEFRGRPAIVLTLTPRPGVRPLEKDSEPMTKIAAKAWVDEEQYEVLRAELEVTDSISFGFGLLGRLSKGTTLAFERQKVNNEAWLPVRVEVRPKATIAIFKRIDAHILSEFSGYRPFTVEQALESAFPKSAK